jgi:preprotein translocase subunit SecA
LTEEGVRERILERVTEAHRAKETEVGSDIMRQAEKWVLLKTMDSHWKDHLAGMDYLRQGVQWRGMAQRNPKQEYKKEAFNMFSQMLEGIKRETIQKLAMLQAPSEADAEAAEAQERRRREQEGMEFQHPDADADGPEVEEGAGNGEQRDAEQQQPFVRDGRKVGRNEPCPCGSGEKYKRCHGRLAG